MMKITLVDRHLGHLHRGHSLQSFPNQRSRLFGFGQGTRHTGRGSAGIGRPLQQCGKRKGGKPYGSMR